MGGAASTATLHGCHGQKTCGDALHGGGTCPAATVRLGGRLYVEKNYVCEQGTAAAAKTLSVRHRGDDCDALPSQTLERQRASLPHGGSNIGKHGQAGIVSPSTAYGDVDEPSSTSNQTVVAATTAGDKKSPRCSSLENDDNGAMIQEEAEKWLKSRPVSPAPCSRTDVKYPAATTVDPSDGASSSGDNRSISSMWPSTPIRSSRSSGTGEEASRSHDTTADVPRNDGKPYSTLSILTSTKSTSGTTPPSLSPNAHCSLTNGVRSAFREQRRDSFSASLQAAMNTSRVTTPKQLFQTRHEGGGDKSPSEATAAAVKGAELKLPRDQQRRSVFPSRPTITVATLRGTGAQFSSRILRKTSRPENIVSKMSRATADAKVSRHRLSPSSLEVDQTSPCSSEMDDEEWQKVSLQQCLYRRDNAPSL